MRLIRPTSLNSMLDSIQISKEVCEIIATEVLVFSHLCDLEYTRFKSMLFNSVYHHNEFEPNWFLNI